MYAHKCQTYQGKEEFYCRFWRTPELVKRATSKKDYIYKLKVTPSDDDPPSYWGWWDNKNDRFKWVYKTRASLVMTFPNIYESERLGYGNAMGVEVEELDAFHKNSISL